MTKMFDNLIVVRTLNYHLVVYFQAKRLNISQFRKFAQVFPNLVQHDVILTNFFNNYKCGVCHRFQDTELHVVVNFEAKAVNLNIENLIKFTQISLNLAQM